MPKYYDYQVGDYYLYFTSQCIVEAFHVHASDKQLTKKGAAKFFVYADGTTKVMNKGKLKSKDISIIQSFIHINYMDMYRKWVEYGGNLEFYGKKDM